MDTEPISYKLLETEMIHLKELMNQHNILTQRAVDKALENTDEKFIKTNEFREQQKDIIMTKANKEDLNSCNKRIDEMLLSINKRFDDAAASSTERYGNATKIIHDKIDLVERGARESRELGLAQMAVRIAALEQARYEAAGAGSPAKFMDRLSLLEASKDQHKGREDSSTKWMGWILFAIALIGFLTGKIHIA